jgi:hypothetical protein
MTEEDLLRALSDPAEFERVINDYYAFYEAVTQFPQHAETLCQKILDDSAEFARLHTHIGRLIGTVKLLPQHKEAFIQKYLHMDCAVGNCSHPSSCYITRKRHLNCN